MIRVIFGLVSIAMIGTAAPIPRELRTVSLDGHWKLVDCYENGIRGGELPVQWIIHGKSLKIADHSVQLIPRPEIGPHAYDIIQHTTTGEMSRACFLEIKDDTLKVTMALEILGERPTCAEGIVGVYYFEFQRVAKPSRE